MSANDILFPIPADFGERSQETHARLVAGETMTNEQIAAALGISVEFFAAALAVYAALITGRPVVVGSTASPSSKRKMN